MYHSQPTTTHSEEKDVPDNDTIHLITTLPINEPDVPPPSMGERGRAVADRVRTALDTAGLPFVFLAEPWKRKSDRRKSLRTSANRDAMREANIALRAAHAQLRNDQAAHERAARDSERGKNLPKWFDQGVLNNGLLNRERASARRVVRDSRALVKDAEQDARAARKNYPQTLRRLATKIHLSAFATSSVIDLVSGGSPLGHALVAGSVAAIACNTIAVPLGLRHLRNATEPAMPATEPDVLQPTQEEAELLQRLEPLTFASLAEERNMADVVCAGGNLTDSGIQAKLTLQGTMDLATLKRREAHLRAVLRLKEGTRLELRDGSTGGHARLTLRTRSKSDSVTLTGWQPGDAWGVNTVTGESFSVLLDRHMLIAGTTGSGKSWSARPLMAEASARDDHRLIVLDMKRIEARLWSHRARIAITAEEIDEVLAELVDEMYERLDLIPRGRDTVEISPAMPRIIVFVDEGGELISESKRARYDEEGKAYKMTSILESLITLSRLARAAGIVLIWATQKPSLSGSTPGLDTSISPNLTRRVGLTTDNETESSVVFSPEMVSNGWKAHQLPLHGWALIKDDVTSRPDRCRLRAISPQQVVDLPAGQEWHRDSGRPSDPWGHGSATDIEARQAIEDPQPVRMSAEERDKQVYVALVADPCVSLSSLAKQLGTGKSTISNALSRLEAGGLVTKDADDCWNPVG
jgi:S-DNA-T family DNA segregation ATPase FtsK/SpoIIIE